MNRLHLGCGDMVLPGWINCDLYDPHAEVRCDVRKLPFGDETVDEIYNAHLIEHFDYFEGQALVDEWKRVLKPGGRLSIETPDFVNLCRVFAEEKEENRYTLYPQFFARPWIPGQTHKFLYTENQLGGLLTNKGFKQVHKVPALRYIGLEHICLRMEGIK
jgi:predicted SAM-dependent methyltransferase